MEKLTVTCPSFADNGQIPKKHTGFGEDISPAFTFDGISDKAQSLCIIMEDLDIPFVSAYPHWLIWNLPVKDRIEENIPYGAECSNGAIQGVAYGRNRYRGPKQPPFVKASHCYRFTFYSLDCLLNLPSTAGKGKLTKAMQGHILQSAVLTGNYKP